MNKVRTQTKPRITPPVDDPTMTLEGYLRAVVVEREEPGRTWAQAYVMVLLEHRPTLAERVWHGNTSEMLYHAEKELPVFLYYVLEHWDHR